MELAVPTNVGQPQDGLVADVGGLEGVLRALSDLHPGGSGLRAPLCCTWMCCAAVGAVRAGAAAPGSSGDLEFEAVLVRRLAERYLRAVADRAAGAPVPRVWRLLLAASSAPPVRLALAGVRVLRDHDLTLAFVGAATVLGRSPGPAERDGYGRVAALLGRCGREVARGSADAGDAAEAARLDDPEARRAAWERAAHLWTLRGRPAEAETARRALDREVRGDAARLLATG
jgi:Family of unknown function (DUF5995)